jgi:hypothetical protein
MKTALQELIEKWENETGSYIPNAPIYKAFINEAKLYLEKEKQQIIDAYHINPKNSIYLNTGIKYYDSTFSDNHEAGI